MLGSRLPPSDPTAGAGGLLSGAGCGCRGTQTARRPRGAARRRGRGAGGGGGGTSAAARGRGRGADQLAARSSCRSATCPALHSITHPRPGPILGGSGKPTGALVKG